MKKQLALLYFKRKSYGIEVTLALTDKAQRIEFLKKDRRTKIPD